MKLHFIGSRSNAYPAHINYVPDDNGTVLLRCSNDPVRAMRATTTIAAILLVALIVRCNAEIVGVGTYDALALVASFFLALACVMLREIIRAAFYKGDVYLYLDARRGMPCATGPESMGKVRFLCMTLLPAAMLGGIPFAICMVDPSMLPLGFFGALLCAMSAGDFLKARAVLSQVPQGARLSQIDFDVYWQLES